MPIASFVIYFHPARLDNLRQAVRLLRRQEPGLWDSAELLLVCQEECHESFGPTSRLINLKQGRYGRPRAFNVGCSEATADVLILLDSDRFMLRSAYFLNTVTSLPVRTVVSPAHVLDAGRAAGDEELLSLQFPFTTSSRYYDPYVRGKTAFSGNTVLRKEDYWSFGGMDENMYGYGFHDNDATLAALKAGLAVKLVPETEIHLWHERDGEAMRSGHARNAEYFKKKWSVG